MQSLIGRGSQYYMSFLLTWSASSSSSIITTTRGSRRFAAAVGLFNVKTRQQLVLTNTTRSNYIRRHCCCCYSTTTSTSKTRKSLLKKVVAIHDDEPPAEDNNDKKKKTKKKNSFYYVVQKGDIVGVYNNKLHILDDSPLSQVCDRPVSVYKGYNMSKEAEAYLVSRGLKDALYTIRAVDFRKDLFGTLMPCPFQHPHDSLGEPQNIFQQLLGSQTERACILEFDGACKGNPGISGAGAVLRTPDGTLFCRLREGLGTATNNVAEYRAMILGLRYALSKGFTSIYVVGDSKLVCMQIQGLWRARHPNMIKWYEEAKKLKDEFQFFQVHHVLRMVRYRRRMLTQ
uniref:uncharacterized protein LOC122584855 isoform X2 n=1 Tax=Erigeron canadensis TaxID=72917 RepID=UPI001CB9B3D7|nr:uncharacterized protein LOC122584855 isoform X2 [Erigeron canadensis]